MKLPQIFAKAANRVAHSLAQTSAFEFSKDAKGKSVVNLLGNGREHKVFKSGKVRTSRRVLARLGLDEIIEAAKDFASPRINMLVRSMTAQKQQELVPVRVDNRPQKRITRKRTDF